MCGEDDGRGKIGGWVCVCEGGVAADAKALESWREPWVGNHPESSRSIGARAPIRKQNAERERRERDLHVQKPPIDQQLKNCTLKSLLTSKS